MVNVTSQFSTASWSNKLSLVALLALGIPMSVSGQSPVLELSGESSGDCTIILTHVATLGDVDGPGWIGGISTITKLADGSYALSSNEESYLIKIFAADGKYLQTIGGRGQGPGEFGYIRYLLTHKDRLHVFDIDPPRHTVYTSDFDVLRIDRFQIRSSFDAEVISDSLTVVNAIFRNPDRIDFTLHSIDQDGNTLQSFAGIPGGYSPEKSSGVNYRILTPGSSGGMWALHRMRYQIEEWSIEGNLIRTIIRRTPWFSDNPTERDGSMRDAQRRRLPSNLWPNGMDVREDDSGRLWVAVRVPDMDWPDAVTVRGSIEGEFVEILDSQRARDTVIEVIDLNTSTLLASKRFDQSLYRFLGNDEIISGKYEEDGSYRVNVWRLSLQYPTPVER